MDYDATDRYMSGWIVTVTIGGLRMYIADNDAETATDMLDRAKWFRYSDQAQACADRQNSEHGWAGHHWDVCGVASEVTP